MFSVLGIIFWLVAAVWICEVQTWPLSSWLLVDVLELLIIVRLHFPRLYNVVFRLVEGNCLLQV